MVAIETIYTAALHLARGLLPLLSYGDSKLARGIRGRRGALARVEAWAAHARDRRRPLVWFHAPSVGEGQQARAAIEALRQLKPDVQIAYTYFSPSAEQFARNSPADIADYFPLDLPAFLARLFDALDPALIAFCKTEVWPNLTRVAERRAVPVVLLSATLPESSSRLRGPARALLTPAHRRLERIAAISNDDATRFEMLGVAPERITVMGDARFDQVWHRTGRPHADPALLDIISDPDRLTIVAGSTWPADEERLIETFAIIAEPRHRYRLIIAPHEPVEPHLARLRTRLEEAGLRCVSLSDAALEGSGESVIIVDRVGILGDLYRLADVAYVGGGFGDAGLHSVLEPAAFGAPVLFGPNHSNAREADDLIRAGGARSVTGTAELTAALASWIEHPEQRRRAGDQAKYYVERGLGAAERGAELIVSLLPSEISSSESR
jgi:3-deoxy-D-manno-octulosonic-acid transferase